jgi:hypothetical protein
MSVYLNTYEVWQVYGGPEEGGWWFEAGTPMQSILVSHDDLEDWLENTPEEEQAAMREHATLGYTQGKAPTPKKTGYGGYTFAPGSDEPLTYQQDNDYRSWFEDSYAEPFPVERPCYC